MDLIEKHKFPTLNISQFYPRPGTVAARMKKLDTKIVKSRSRKLTKLFKSYICFKERIGEIHRVLITEKARDGHHFVGHNKNYDHFLVPPMSDIGRGKKDMDLMGCLVEVEILQLGKYHILSKITQKCLENLWKWEGDKDGYMKDVIGKGWLPTDGLSRGGRKRRKEEDGSVFKKGVVGVVVFVVLLAFVINYLRL